MRLLFFTTFLITLMLWMLGVILDKNGYILLLLIAAGSFILWINQYKPVVK